MSVNAVKYMTRMFNKTGSLEVAPGRGQRATEQAISEEVAIAIAEVSANFSNATVRCRTKNNGIFYLFRHRCVNK